jgi:hypothetical protein
MIVVFLVLRLRGYGCFSFSFNFSARDKAREMKIALLGATVLILLDSKSFAQYVAS